MSNINIRHLHVRQLSGITANTVNIGSRCRIPPKKILGGSHLKKKTRTYVISCQIKTLKMLRNFCAKVFLQ